jgi:DNA-binding NarL/FixJ family response regulator
MPMRRFSPREYDVIQAIINGHTTYKAIGKALKPPIGTRAVQDHLLNIYRLTDVDNMAGLVLWLIEHGYITGNRP